MGVGYVFEAHDRITSKYPGEALVVGVDRLGVRLEVPVPLIGGLADRQGEVVLDLRRDDLSGLLVGRRIVPPDRRRLSEQLRVRCVPAGTEPRRRHRRPSVGR